MTGRRALVISGAGALAAVALLSGCGGTATSTTTTFHALQPPAHHHRPPRPRPIVGDTQRVHTSGTTLSVTVRAVVDLRGSGAALLPQSRAIGVVAEIRNDGPGVYDSSSTGDFSVLPSSGFGRPVFAPTGSCQTPLRDWDNDISEGELRSGCVAYSVQAEARIVAVRFSPHAAAAGRATWLVHR